MTLRAIEKKKGRSPGLLMQGFAALSDGRLMAQVASAHLPNVPPSISCAIAYWHGVDDGVPK